MAKVKSSTLNVTDIGFDDISDNLKNFLKGQDAFKDYNFEGSNLATLIDLLAYSSHISAFNTNLAASEMFLDSAQIRKNVVSRAKDLGFTPSSVSSATSVFDIELVGVRSADGTIPSSAAMTLSRGQRFSTVYNGTTYEFVCTASVTPTQSGTTFSYPSINVKQGVYVTDTFIYDSTEPNPKFVLSNLRSDVTSLGVKLISDGETSSYSKAENVSSITTTAKVYYTQENEDGYTELYFGDDTLGAKPFDGDIIQVTYIVVDSIHANGALNFALVDNINGFSDASIQNVTTAYGGAEKESIESIKFKASKSYASQNRLVTLDDYKSKVSEFYPNADAIAIWGGEDNNPPEYGKIFLSLKPVNSNYLSEAEKANVVAKLRDLNILTVRPVIVDAKVIDIVLDVVFKYNPREATVSLGELESAVETAIDNYDSNFLNGFDSIFRYSKFSSAIDNANSSILSSISRVKLKYEQIITKNKSLGYTVNFGNGLYHPHDGHNASGGGILQSTGFKVSGDSVNTQFFDDDGKGNLRRYYQSGANRVYVDSEAGSVNYGTGEIKIDGINITDTSNADSTIAFTVTPVSNDVVSSRGQLIDIKLSNVTVRGEADTIASGESSAGVGFSSTPTYS